MFDTVDRQSETMLEILWSGRICDNVLTHTIQIELDGLTACFPDVIRYLLDIDEDVYRSCVLWNANWQGKSRKYIRGCLGSFELDLNPFRPRMELRQSE